MGVARARPRQLHAVMTAGRPFVHHGVGHVGVELQRESTPGANRLYLERIALREQFGARRQIKTFAVPLIDAFRPRPDHGKAGSGWPDRVIADLGMTARVAKHLAAKLARAHLRAEADAEKRLVLAQRHADPIDFPANEIILVVGAHRTAEDNRR